MNQSTIDFLRNSMCIIWTSWHSFLDLRGKKITMTEVEDGIEMIRNLLYPYLKESYRIQVLESREKGKGFEHSKL